MRVTLITNASSYDCDLDIIFQDGNYDLVESNKEEDVELIP